MADKERYVYDVLERYGLEYTETDGDDEVEILVSAPLSEWAELLAHVPLPQRPCVRWRNPRADEEED